MGMQTPILTHAWQGLYPLKHLPSIGFVSAFHAV